MHVQLWEPPKQRRLRIKNKIRFAIFVFIVLTLLAVLIHRFSQPAKQILLDRFMALKMNLDYWFK